MMEGRWSGRVRFTRTSAYLRRFHAEPLPIGIDRKDLDRHAGVDRPRLLVRETSKAVGLDERPERHLLGHHAVDDVTDLVAGHEFLPAHVSPPFVTSGLRASRDDGGLLARAVIKRQPGTRSVHGSRPTRQS